MCNNGKTGIFGDFPNFERGQDGQDIQEDVCTTIHAKDDRTLPGRALLCLKLASLRMPGGACIATLRLAISSITLGPWTTVIARTERVIVF